MKLRYLPPGTLRRLRLKWLALGVALGAGSMSALAMYLAAIVPPELAYRSATATHRPCSRTPIARCRPPSYWRRKASGASRPSGRAGRPLRFHSVRTSS